MRHLGGSVGYVPGLNLRVGREFKPCVGLSARREAYLKKKKKKKKKKEGSMLYGPIY